MNGKRIIAVALMAALCLTGITLIPVENVRAGTEITYMDAVVDPETHEVTYTEAVATCIEVKDLEDKTKWGADGETVWYAVTESETIDRRITVSGTVNLILCDHITLNANRGITTTGATLNIYGQSGGTGTLYAGATEHGRFNAPDFCAGIGGDYSAGGTVTINGGNVIASGAPLAAGIGGGLCGSGGTIEINGGSVMSISSGFGAGIGGGNSGAGGEITINGGNVTATGGEEGAGIGGGGMGGDGGTVSINGGYVEAKGKDGAEAIGKGKDGHYSGTLMLGKGVVCYDDNMNVLQPDENGFIPRTQFMKTVYVPEEPPIFADYTCKVDGKVKIPVGKKVKKVTVEDETIASVKKKGKKVIVYGKAPGTVNVTAYGKKNKVLGNWIVKVE